MAKVLVVFLGDDASDSAELAATGAKTVRFTEVDIRSAATTTTRHRLLDPAADVRYDGVVIAANGSTSEGHDALLTALRPSTDENTVFASPGSPELAARLVGAMGGLVVGIGSPSLGDPSAVAARVAKVAGWVRHGLGHEAEAHSHGTGHSHSHHKH